MRPAPRHRPEAQLGPTEVLEEDVLFFDFDQETILELIRAGNLPHRHAYHELIWVRNGAAEHLLDGESLRAPAPSFLVIPEGRVHRFTPAPRLAGCVVRFRESFLPDSSSILFNQFVGTSCIDVPPTIAAEIDALIALARLEWRSGDPSATPLRHLLRALIAKIESLWFQASGMQRRARTDSQRLWVRFSRLVEARYLAEHSPGYYARELGMSSRRLNTVARLFAGTTVAEAIGHRLVLEAKRQLLFSDLSVGEISFALGFEEHSYFTRVFRKRVGMTPSEYRDAVRRAGCG